MGGDATATPPVPVAVIAPSSLNAVARVPADVAAPEASVPSVVASVPSVGAGVARGSHDAAPEALGPAVPPRPGAVA